MFTIYAASWVFCQASGWQRQGLVHIWMLLPAPSKPSAFRGREQGRHSKLHTSPTQSGAVFARGGTQGYAAGGGGQGDIQHLGSCG